ncbi:RNA polymerase sigma factor [Chitinophaga lutea]
MYDHYSTALNGVISSIVPDADTVGDVLQEVFVKIFRQIENYDPSKGRLFTWMFQIARSTAIDTIRSADWQNSRRNNALSEAYTSLPDKTQHPSEQYGLRKMVHMLKEEQKVLVDLSYFQGYKQDEIAKMLNIPLSTVKTRLRAALVQLRKQVKL